MSTEPRFVVQPNPILGYWIQHTEWTDHSGKLVVQHTETPVFALTHTWNEDPLAKAHEFVGSPLDRYEFSNGWRTSERIVKRAAGWAVVDTLRDNNIVNSFDSLKKAEASARNNQKTHDQYVRFSDAAIKAAMHPQSVTLTDRAIADIGMFVECYGQQRVRIGVVVDGKPNSKNIKVMWVTPTALNEAAKYGHRPSPAMKTVSRETGC
jgi:hypothetical protein